MKQFLAIFLVIPALSFAQAIYGPQVQYQGTTTVPVTMQPNTIINAPRQVPQAPVVKGW